MYSKFSRHRAGNDLAMISVHYSSSSSTTAIQIHIYEL